MTRLVVSVRNLGEAKLAHGCGADLVDLKEPTQGSLGAVDERIARDVCSAWTKRDQPLSVALGELLDLDVNQDFSFLQGIQYVKVGLAGSFADLNLDANPEPKRDDDCAVALWKQKLEALQGNLPLGSEMVAVYYADRLHCGAPEFEAILHFAYLHDMPAMLFDTYDKHLGCLFEHCHEADLREMFSRCECAGLKTVLAGSVKHEHLDKVKKLNPDYVAVRGAVCNGDRTGQIDRHSLQRFSRELKNNSRQIDSKSNKSIDCISG